MTSHADEVIATLSASQQGVVTRRQLVAAGVSTDTVEYRVKAGRLRSLHRGVYMVGPLVGPRARELAAVLACGVGAVLSHRSAAVLWQLLRQLGGSAALHVTVTGSDCGRRPGIRTHRVAVLDPAEATVLDGIPVTTPCRTVIDLAGTIAAREVEQAIAQAERRRLFTRAELLTALQRHANRRGVRLLRSLLREDRRPVLTRSEAEERCLALFVTAQLPMPEVNVDVAGHEVDFLWRRERVVVEVDGFAYHSSPVSFESDRRRDATLSAAGYRVLRITWRQIVDEPVATLVRIAQTLTRMCP